MARVLEINDLDQLAEYRASWNSLHRQTADASFFHSFDWLATYWRHFGDEQRLRILVAHESDKPIGILPLVVRREANRLSNVRVLTYPLHDWGSFYGPIGPDPAATLLAGLAHIRETKPDWDLIDLRWVDDTLDHDRTPNAMQACGFAATSAVWGQSAQVEIAGTWDEYLASRQRSFRKKIRYAEKRLGELGEVSYLRYRSQSGDDPRWDLYDACEELARRSWQGRSTTGTTLSHESVRPFLRDAHVAASRAGAADISLLYVAGEAVAFAYCYSWQGYVFGLRMGYDAEHAKSGAGTVLVARLIRDAFDHGERIVDLGAEYLTSKLQWTTRLAESYHYTHFRPGGLKAQALRLKRWLAGVNHRRHAGKS